MRLIYLSLLTFFTFSTVIHAQEKVIETSGDKPQWVAKTMPEWIIVSSSAQELMAAQEECMEMVKQEIVNSVAVNISSSSTLSKSQTTHNDEYDFYSKYSSEIKTITAQLPYISGISITDAETYWEKIFIKKEKTYFYRYYLRFPFTNAMKQRLIMEFKRIDNEKENRLKQLQLSYEQISSVEEIGSCLIEAKTLSEYFFDDNRKTEAVLLQKKFNDLYNHIMIQPINNVPGEYSFMIMLNDKPISMSKMPRLKSDYVTNLTITRGKINNSFIIKYSYKGCIPDDPNTIEALFYYGNRTMKHEFRFDLSGESPDLKFPGLINVTLKKVSAEDINIHIGIDILAGEGNKFLINEFVLNINELENQISIMDIQDTNIKQGKNHYEFNYMSKNSLTEKKGVLTEGHIKLTNIKNGENNTVKIQRPYKVIYK